MYLLWYIYFFDNNNDNSFKEQKWPQEDVSNEEARGIMIIVIYIALIQKQSLYRYFTFCQY